MSSLVHEADLASGSTLTLIKASNGLGKGIRYELHMCLAGHGEALVTLTPGEALELAEAIQRDRRRAS